MQSFEEPHRLLVRPADHLVDALDQLLRAESLRRVKAAIDPHDSLSLACEPVRLIVAQPLRQREPPRDVAVLRQGAMIRRRRHDRHQLRAAFGGLADFLDRQPVGFSVELLPVLRELRIVGELVVVPDVEAEVLLRTRDACLRRERNHGRGDQDGENETSHEGEYRRAAALVGYAGPFNNREERGPL